MAFTGRTNIFATQYLNKIVNLYTHYSFITDGMNWQRRGEKTKVDAPHAISGFHNYMQTFIFIYVIINKNLRSIGLLFTESFALQRTLI